MLVIGTPTPRVTAPSTSSPTVPKSHITVTIHETKLYATPAEPEWTASTSEKHLLKWIHGFLLPSICPPHTVGVLCLRLLLVHLLLLPVLIVVCSLVTIQQHVLRMLHSLEGFFRSRVGVSIWMYLPCHELVCSLDLGLRSTPLHAEHLVQILCA